MKKQESNSLSIFIKNEENKLHEKLLKKVPNWLNNYEIELPKLISIEQASSESTAIIKSSLLVYDSIVDLTGGFGIDSYYFSKKAKKLYFVEKNNELMEIVKRNFLKMNVKNIEFFNDSAENFLESHSGKVDLIYCDPSRRTDSKKVFKLEDSEPKIAEIFDLVKSKTNYFLLKTSPFLDINSVINSYENISKIVLISIENELKEVLYLFDFINYKQVVNEVYLLNKSYGAKYTFLNSKNEIEYSLPLNYLFEPDSAILKLGNFSEISQLFRIKKIEPNSHLFTSNNPILEFPGKVYKILGIEKVESKSIKKYSDEMRFNLKVRNFPLSVDDLKTKLKINDGGNLYVFASKLIDKKYKLIICEKVII